MQRLAKALWTLSLILAPAVAQAQFESLRFADIPPVGSWAEYQVLRRNESFRQVQSLKLAFISRQVVGPQEYWWFQIEQEDDALGPKRVTTVTQLGLTKEDALSKQGWLGKARELIVQVGDGPALRVRREWIEFVAGKNLLTSGEGGGTREPEYAFRDLEGEAVETRAGKFTCQHKKGLARAEVVLDHTKPNPPRYPVDTILDLWLDASVPFGVVKKVAKVTGQGPQSETVTTRLDTEETTELVAFGTGAKSAIRGTITDYDPATVARAAAGAGQSGSAAPGR